jgi:chemotaxis protein methyltransferase CheR
LWNEELAHTVIADFSITVTEMFRDPDFYQAVRQKVVPYLSTYPFFKVWVTGCATGEEVYSLAILLQEEGLYNRASIYATDFNDKALKKAQDGVYPLKDLQKYTVNYQKAGGKRSFADYYRAENNSATIDPALKANISFANHNLVTDGIFSEVQMIFCRNVLIYFDQTLQNWVLTMLTESLSHNGFLCLGNKESLELSDVGRQFRTMDEAQRIYQKRKV